jgi:hypothetical protein
MEINDALVTAITRELLKRLGAGEVSFSEADVKKILSEKTSSGPCCENSRTNTPVSANRKRVINETEIKQLCPASKGAGQSLEIGHRDIVTPLAEDYIVKMGISVHRV